MKRMLTLLTLLMALALLLPAYAAEQLPVIGILQYVQHPALDAARAVADTRTRAEHEAAEVRRTLPGRLAIAARDAATQEEAEAHVRRLLAGHVAGL